MLISTIFLASYAILSAASLLPRNLGTSSSLISAQILWKGPCSPTISDGTVIFIGFSRRAGHVWWLGFNHKITNVISIRGTVGRVFTVDSHYELTLWPLLGKHCGEILLTSPSEGELRKFRDNLMNSKVRWLSKLEGFQGIVIHPDDVRNGWAYGRGIMGHLSLKGLTRAFNSFSEGWMGRLKKERRGKFIFRFTDGSSEASWNTRGDQILMKDASKSSLIQVVGSPRFPQGHFELLHKMHPSTFAMIPAAAMAIRVMDLEEVEVKHRRELPEAFDWAHQFTDPLTPGLVKLNRHDIGEKLGKILKALRGTKQMAFWGDVPLSYSVNTDNERALEEVPDDGRLLDVIFTTGFDFSEDCDEILEEYAKDITSLAAIQYEAIMTRALGKVPDIESIHLYPLLPMRGKLLEMNLQALTRSIQKLTIYYPDLIIYFYAMHPVATLPKTGVWRKTASAIRKSMYVERQLFTKGPRKDEIFYTIEREKGLGN